MYKSRIILVFIFLTSLVSLLAQESSYFVIRDIQIEGNRWTRDYVVFRELTFQLGDTISAQSLPKVKLENKERVKAIGMFNNVVVQYDTINQNGIVCRIDVNENWYIYPSVILELSDRNFTDWWVNHNADLSRTNYGARLDHINLTGNRDKLIAQLQFGFRRKYELVYNLPFLTRDGKWGMETSVFYATQDEIAYKTVDNKTQFAGLSTKQTLLQRFRSGASVFYRPNVYAHHAFKLEYHKNSVDPYVISDLNPNYFLEGRSAIRFFLFNYHFTYDRRIAQFYPVGGYLVFADIKKEGFRIFDEYNNTSVAIGAEYYKSITKKLIFGTENKLKVNLDRRVVGFANNTGLGWGEDALLGYALYVIDGTDFFYSKNNLRYKIFDVNVDMSNWMPLRQFEKMNLQLHNRYYFETGYVNDPTYRIDNNNNFNNRWLFSYGTALDIIAFNNNMASFHFGFNHLFEFGYVFQYRTNF